MALDAMTTALIVGAGSGLSASLARRLSDAGLAVALAARNAAKLSALAAEIGGHAFGCDAAEPDQVAALFDAVVDRLGVPDVVIYNPSARARGPIAELDPADVARGLAVTAFGGFLVGQQAARAMLPRGSGTIVFTGASASIKGFAGSASFAMGKFALRGPGAEHGARAGAEGHPCRARAGRWRHTQRRQPRSVGSAGQPARSGRHRRRLSAPDPAAAQRVEPRDRPAAMDGTVLAAPAAGAAAPAVVAERADRPARAAAALHAAVPAARAGRVAVAAGGGGPGAGAGPGGAAADRPRLRQRQHGASRRGGAGDGGGGDGARGGDGASLHAGVVARRAHRRRPATRPVRPGVERCRPPFSRPRAPATSWLGSPRTFPCCRR